MENWSIIKQVLNENGLFKGTGRTRSRRVRVGSRLLGQRIE